MLFCRSLGVAFQVKIIPVKEPFYLLHALGKWYAGYENNFFLILDYSLKLFIERLSYLIT